MGFDETLFSREGDGWYAEKANTMATLASEIDIYPAVQLPSRLNGGIFIINSNIKADWADISINNSTTADVQNNQINISTGEILDMNITHQLINFDKWYELRLIVDNNSNNLNFVSGTTTIPFSREDNDYVVDLTSFNAKRLAFVISGVVNIKNIILKCHVAKSGSGSTSIDITNVNNLENRLSIIQNNFNEEIDYLDDTKVPTTRKINNKTLNEDITLTNADIGSQPKFKTVTQDVTLKSAGVNTNIQVIGSGGGYRVYGKYNGHNMPYLSTTYNGANIVSNGVQVQTPSNTLKVLEVTIKNTTSSYLANMATLYILVERSSLRFDIYFHTNDLNQTTAGTAFNDIVAKPIQITVTYLVYE